MLLNVTGTGIIPLILADLSSSMDYYGHLSINSVSLLRAFKSGPHMAFNLNQIKNKEVTP